MSRLRTWWGIGLWCLVAVGVTREAAAQDAPAAEVSGGYQFFSGKGENEEEWEHFPKGWYFDATANVTNSVGIVGQVSGNYKHFDDETSISRSTRSWAASARARAGRYEGLVKFLLAL